MISNGLEDLTVKENLRLKNIFLIKQVSACGGSPQDQLHGEAHGVVYMDERCIELYDRGCVGDRWHKGGLYGIG